RAQFITQFKEVQRLKTQLDQYTDLDAEQQQTIKELLPPEELRSFRSVYIDTAKRFKERQDNPTDNTPPEVEQLDFEFVLFASALIDYDYIMGLIAKSTGGKPSKHTMTPDQLINMLSATANMMDEREDMMEYIRSLDFSKGRTEKEIRDGYKAFKKEKNEKEIRGMAEKHGLDMAALQAFTARILDRMIFDGEQLSDLLAPLNLGWKERAKKETELMKELVPYLKKQARGHEISGLNAYDV
ncbi:MAG: type I restriction endonuclease subunit R, partial [Taibaiella sp.]|nr:type I restriction endonuclease subunit R [Taibaiella sp.]